MYVCLEWNGLEWNGIELNEIEWTEMKCSVKYGYIYIYIHTYISMSRDHHTPTMAQMTPRTVPNYNNAT